MRETAPGYPRDTFGFTALPDYEDLMLHLLQENPILLLFAIIGIGQLLGRIQIAGFGLGLAAVLFTGLAFGAFDAELKLPEFVYLFGLILFVYTIGLSSGPGFFASFRTRGLRDNARATG